jgi:hypothetical protein
MYGCSTLSSDRHDTSVTLLLSYAGEQRAVGGERLLNCYFYLAVIIGSCMLQRSVYVACCTLS